MRAILSAIWKLLKKTHSRHGITRVGIKNTKPTQPLFCHGARISATTSNNENKVARSRQYHVESMHLSIYP
jgi:hypothetical protein